MPELNQDAVLKTVQHHLPTYFGKAHIGHVKTIGNGEMVVDDGFTYIAVKQDGDALVPTSNMTWDGDEYGLIENLPERMMLIS
jgi:hypothetical protein